MARYCGMIGYVTTKEKVVPRGDWYVKTGEYEDAAVERKYFGDYMKNPTSHWQSSDHSNDDLDVSNKISIVADGYAMGNFQHIKYAEFQGTKWKVTSIEVQRPRLILTLGGVYNG